MTNPLRDKLEKATAEIFGTLSDLPGKPIWEVFGVAKGAPKAGASNWYDTTAFYAQTNVHFGDNYDYVYNQGKLLTKPMKFHRLTAGVKITEEQMSMDMEELVAIVESKAQKQERGLRAKADYEFNGYAADVAGTGAGWGALKLGIAATPTLADPFDCNSTSGTVEPLGAVNFTGAGKTAEPLNATVGHAIRLIAAAVLDAETGESILRNDGTDTFTLWCHPTMAAILRTNKEIKIAAAELESRTYAQILKEDWNTEIQPSMALGACTGVADATTVIILTANTVENFLIVPVEKPYWMAWKDIDDGEKISFVKRYKAGLGALPRCFIDADGNPYKAMVAMAVTPNGA